MTSPHWPLAGLRLHTPRLELRWPTLDDLDELATLAAAGVHDPQVQPFSVARTDAPAGEPPSRSLQYHWSQWATWRARRPLRVRVSGLEPCLPWFGLSPAAGQPAG